MELRFGDRHDRRPGRPTAGEVLLVGSVFTALGAVVLVLGLLGVLRGRASGGWTRTPCVITRSRLGTNGPFSRPGESLRDHVQTYWIDIAYRYTVDGLPYDGTQYEATDGGGGNVGVDAMRRAVASRPVGSSQICYVDPADPRQAVLVPGATWRTWAVPLAGLLFFGLGAVMVWPAVRRFA